MTRISWDEPDSRAYSAGVDRGVLYLQNGSGLAWAGLLSVDEAPSGFDTTDNYYDGYKFNISKIPGSFDGSIKAYSYPPEFELYNGMANSATGRSRLPFSFSYRSYVLSSDSDLTNKPYLIHIVYNAVSFNSDKNHATISGDLIPFIFEFPFTTSPSAFGNRVGSHLMIDSRTVHQYTLEALEEILYGTDDTDPRLPSPDEILDLFESGSTLIITDHGDGTWSADGPDEAVQMITTDMFMINWPSVLYLNPTTYEVNSL